MNIYSEFWDRAGLSPSDLTAVLLRWRDGVKAVPYRIMAQEMGVSLSVAQSRYNKGLRLLRKPHRRAAVVDLVETAPMLVKELFGTEDFRNFTANADPMDDLSVRTFNALRNCEIRTIEDACLLSASDLRRMKNLGKKGIAEVEDWLLSNGFSLPPDPTEIRRERCSHCGQILRTAKKSLDVPQDIV